MIGFLYTLTVLSLLTFSLADVITATCFIDASQFVGFGGTITLAIDNVANTVTAIGQVKNNPAGKWAANEKHAVQVRNSGDISNSCLNTGAVFWDFGDAETDANANLQLNFNALAAPGAIQATAIVGLSVVVLKDAEANEAGSPVVACCTIEPPVAQQMATTAAQTTAAAWPYNWPPNWIPPPGCAVPASYQAYYATYQPPPPTTKATTTTAAYQTYWITVAAPPPATTAAATTAAWNPYAPAAPPPPPPPPPAAPVYYWVPYYPGQYYTDTTTTKATTTAYNYCWTCPSGYYGQEPPTSAYYLVPCAQAACVPSYNVRCAASNVVLGALSALVAALALLL